MTRAAADGVSDVAPCPAATTIALATGSFGTGVYATVPSVLLLYFCTETLHIAPAVASLVVLLPKIWSIGWDPFVGSVYDRLTAQSGRRPPFLEIGLIGLVTLFVALFSPPASVTVIQAGWWVGIAYFLLVGSYALYSVPYAAVPARMGATPVAQRKLIDRRLVLVMIGILAGSSGAPLLVEWLGGGRAGYRGMAMVLAAFCAITMIFPILAMRSGALVPQRADGTAGSIWAGWRHAFLSRRFRYLLLSQFAQSAGFAMFFATIPYLVTLALRRDGGDVSVVLATLLCVAMVSVAPWSSLTKRRGWFWAMSATLLMFAIGASATGLAAAIATSWWLFLVTFPVVGLGFGGLQLLQQLGAARAIQRLAPGEEAAVMGVWVASEKAALGCGGALAGLVLSVFPATSATFAIVAGVLPAALCGLAIVASYAARTIVEPAR